MRREPLEIDGIEVTPDEHRLADVALDCFSRHKAVRVLGEPWRSLIIQRVREFPNLTGDEHCRIIASNFVSGRCGMDSTPATIYGTANTFIQSLEFTIPGRR